MMLSRQASNFRVRPLTLAEQSVTAPLATLLRRLARRRCPAH